ncbi:MAG TPA: hemolysin III family protein [Thioalkalivibrio sp.]|nr:hemolysin III family protein [Thioalkalivibrio sp.]
MHPFDRHAAEQRAERFNAISHVVGAALAFPAAVVLVVYASLNGDAREIVAFSVYGVTLFLLYLVSALYHGLNGRPKGVFQVLDHQAIYLLIAGTYTPFTLDTLRDTAWGWTLFGITWGMAILGVVYEVLWQRGPRIVPVIIYVAMGWSIVLALDPLLARISPAGFGWLLAGGLLYTGGIAFFIVSHWRPGAHGIWHLFVLAASAAHYIGILFYSQAHP